MVVVVCISLVAFLLMDALVGPKSFFNQKTEVGAVNGESMDVRDFTALVQNQENMYLMQNPGATPNDEMRHQIREQVWNKFIQDKLLGEEYEKLGIGFSPEELHDLTLTNDADPQIKAIPAFQNPQTGEFDPNRVAAFWQSLKNAPADDQQAAQQREQWLQLEEYLQNSSKGRKFYSLVSQALYVPSWLAGEREAEQNTFATISYVSQPYTAVPDSSVKLSDTELQKYIDNHQELYKREPSRSIQYVSFDAIPTAGDTADILKRMDGMIAEMDTISKDELSGFIARNSETKFYDGYIPANMIQSDQEDSLLALPDGGTLGPYFDNNNMVYAKMIGKKTIPDTVEMKQLLIATQAVPDSEAKKRIDSLESVVRAGGDFDALVEQFSDGSKQEGGKLVLTPGNPNIPEDMNNFAFDHKTGDVGVVKSEYGYHLLKITDQKDFGPAYKIAYLTLRMDPSQETDNAMFSGASRFAGTNNTRDKFEKAANGQDGVKRRDANDIKPTDYSIPNIGPCRDLVQWAYKAKVGEVSGVISLGDKYVIAVLTGIQEKGTATLASVRPQVEAIVRRQKKAALLADKMKGSSLEEVAKNTGDSIAQAQHIGFLTPFIPDAGFEPKVVGAAFDPALKEGKLSKPVYGNNGVYVLKVDSLETETPEAGNDQLVKQEEMMLRQQVSSQIIDILKKEADIEDHRLKFF